MKFHHPDARLFVPDGTPEADALARTTHLGIGAHQDDLEFMALHGILACHQRADRWFGGVTATNGAGSARAGAYADCTDGDMRALRREEQENAARIGQYGFMAQLDYPSSEVKTPEGSRLVDELAALLDATRPEVVYTHNPADKHETHIGVTAAVLKAIRSLPRERRPDRLLGCEVWRGLDWMADEEKVVLDVGGHENLAAALNGVFDSQIAGGKRYDLAVLGRRRANATFFDSHSVDDVDQAWFAMDLTPLVQREEADITGYVQDAIDRFAEDVRTKLTRHFPRSG